ncbi:MAG TPA: peptidoglycan-binding domain-containing protein [Candidatus Saccharimonas sp.]|nr:peptidoglycan-binding domain-containing protein [Candidatus Saccharimonas sp.]
MVIKLSSYAATDYHTLAYCPKPHPTIRYGSTGNCVRYMQAALDTSAGGSHGLAIDGSFGPASLSAVKSYQSKHGLYADGIVGTNTWGSLDAVVPPSSGTSTGSSVTVFSNGSSSLSACSAGGGYYSGSTFIYNGVKFTPHAASGASMSVSTTSNQLLASWPAGSTAPATVSGLGQGTTLLGGVSIGSAGGASPFTLPTLPGC